MMMIEKVAKLSKEELDELNEYDRKNVPRFRRMASRPQAALGSQRAQAALGAMSGGTLANLIARGSKYTRKYKGLATLAGVAGGAAAAGGAGMMAQKSKGEAAKMFPYEGSRSKGGKKR